MEHRYLQYLHYGQEYPGILKEKCVLFPKDVKEAAYKTMLRPILEYGSSGLDPYRPTQGLQDELEYRAARFVTRNYTREEGSMTGVLEQLKWESLKKRRRDKRLLLL